MMKSAQEWDSARTAFLLAMLLHCRAIGFKKPATTLASIRCAEFPNGAFRCEADCKNGIRAIARVMLYGRNHDRASVVVEETVRTLINRRELPSALYQVTDIQAELRALRAQPQGASALKPEPAIEPRLRLQVSLAMGIFPVADVSDSTQIARPTHQTHWETGVPGCWVAKRHPGRE